MADKEDIVVTSAAAIMIGIGLYTKCPQSARKPSKSAAQIHQISPRWILVVFLLQGLPNTCALELYHFQLVTNFVNTSLINIHEPSAKSG